MLQNSHTSLEIQYKRLQDLITALKYQESLERIPVSRASELLIAYCRGNQDPLIGNEERPGTSMNVNPFVKKASGRKRFFCF